jgi:hypothetical protein
MYVRVVAVPPRISLLAHMVIWPPQILIIVRLCRGPTLSLINIIVNDYFVISIMLLAMTLVVNDIYVKTTNVTTALNSELYPRTSISG